MVGVVGVERLARDDAPAVYDLVVGDIVDAGVARDVSLFFVMRLNLAEELHSGLELVGQEMLVAHHQYVMLSKGTLEDGAGLGVDWFGEVEAEDFDAGVICQGRDREGRHRMSLRQGVQITLEPGRGEGQGPQRPKT